MDRVGHGGGLSTTANFLDPERIREGLFFVAEVQLPRIFIEDPEKARPETGVVN